MSSNAGPPSVTEQRAVPYATPAAAAQGAPAYMYPAPVQQQWVQQPQVQWLPANSSVSGSPMQVPLPNAPMQVQMHRQTQAPMHNGAMQMPMQGPSLPMQGSGQQAVATAYYVQSNSPYVHFPGPSGRRGPGRPPGSKNKRKLAQETDELVDEPPANRSRSAAKPKFVAVEIPFVGDWDHEIPGDIRAACSKCTCNKAMFLALPCAHYGFCQECLTKQEKKCKDFDCPVSCLGCGGEVEQYDKYYRASMSSA
ncbi:Putative E3 ubiquitin-protein ligase XBAT35 [Frankliniella fusca]|uniref:E3 ubiquitin-protein ligase XBAT35 n=1 Tax=Frankliniella fusca TaxID=407009 RepID=A0AAE1HMN7_9NEOP|nr:Putative E3 ubiquitin-protein ligase XBAT35 [Frankliniella fusca]